MQQRQPRPRKRMLGRQQQPGKQQQNALPLKYMPPVSRGGLGQCVSAEVCMSLKSATRLERLLFEARRLLLASRVSVGFDPPVLFAPSPASHARMSILKAPW